MLVALIVVEVISRRKVFAIEKEKNKIRGENMKKGGVSNILTFSYLRSQHTKQFDRTEPRKYKS